MIKVQYRFLFLLIVNLFLLVSMTNAQLNKNEGHIEVSIRMIGHKILLHLGDSTSRVLPIEKENNQYKIRFATDFAFDPEKIETIIDTVINETNISNSYLVEIKICDSSVVVHSFEKAQNDNLDVIPCGTREQPLGCYSVFITLYDSELSSSIPVNENNEAENSLENSNTNLGIWLILIGLFLGGIFFYFFRKKGEAVDDPDVVIIGKYRLNKRKMELAFEDDKIELTSKEADLLTVLHDFVNNTIEREVILNTVWGDEGDYVGRTLDVFISKLRKKLEEDASVKIINVRGVGYKLVVG